MDWLLKAVLTSTTVLLVMVAARRGSPRLAGMVAALPTITAPTLAWLAHEQGVTFAVDAAVGSVSACAMLAMFAIGYAWACRRAGRAVALACGVAAALLMAWPACVASARLVDALTLAFACGTLAMAAIPERGALRASVRRRSPRTLVWVAAATGSLSALAATAGPALGGFAAGLLSSLPLVSAAAVMVEHAAGGAHAAEHFLRGYVRGLFSKAAFGAVFALLAARTGAPLAMAVACGCAVLISLARIRPLRMPLAAAPEAVASRAE